MTNQMRNANPDLVDPVEDVSENPNRHEPQRQEIEKQVPEEADLADAFRKLSLVLTSIESSSSGINGIVPHVVEDEGDVGVMAAPRKSTIRRNDQGQRNVSGDNYDAKDAAEDSGPVDAFGRTRIDLIGMAIETLGKLHEENRELYQELQRRKSEQMTVKKSI